MDLLWCLVSVLVFGVCHGVNRDLEDGEEILDLENDDRTGRANRKGFRQNGTRIIGGQPTKEPIPYQVSLQILAITKWEHFCGGSIISKSHVLTAAHCLEGVRAEQMSVVVGTVSLKSGGIRHTVAGFKIHPKYVKTGVLLNDLAVIKVKTPFQLNSKTISAIRLADKFGAPEEASYPVTLTGWGSISPTNHAASIPDHLMYLDYNTISNLECRLRGYPVTPNEICTFYGKKKGACVGDSGGPLVSRDLKVQIGTVSYGSPNCASGTPDVYTRVANFIPWILQVVKTQLP